MSVKRKISNRAALYLSLLIVIGLFFGVACVSFAASPDELVAVIEAYEGGGLAAVADGDTVTVTGAVSDAASTLELECDDGVTVIWGAALSGDADELVRFSGGTLIITDGGAIEQTGDGDAIWAAGDIAVDGGSVSAADGNAIQIDQLESATITLNDGIICADSGIAIFREWSYDSVATIVINGGTVASNTGFAINLTSDSDSIIINGGEITNSNAAENTNTVSVRNNNYLPNVIVNGGVIRNVGISGYAVYTNSLVFVNGGAIEVSDDDSQKYYFEADAMAIERAQTKNIYHPGAADDLAVLPETANAVWQIEGGKHGIRYENLTNEGFFEVPGVTIKHNYIIPVAHQDATCLEGYDTFKCDFCEETETTILPPTGAHAWVADSTIPPACASQGYTVFNCTICGENKNDDALPAIGHDIITESEAATCLTDGYIKTFCSRCADIDENVALPAAGHDWQTGAIVPPDATSQGYTIYTCSVCGEEKHDDYVPAIGGGSGGATSARRGNLYGSGAKSIEPDRIKTEAELVVVNNLPETETPLAIYEPPVDLLYNITLENPFADINENDWYFSDVLFAYYLGMMSGTGDDPMTFSPNEDITLGMLLTILYRIDGCPDVDSEEKVLIGLSGGEYYYDAAIWAIQNGIIQGNENGEFYLEDAVTREQLAAVIYRYQDVSGYMPPEVNVKNEFADQNDIAEYALASVEALSAQSLIYGKPNNLFDPGGFATRAEMAAILRRYIEALLMMGNTP